MKIIVGLGNPDKKYKLSRHNIGRLTLTDWQKAADFPDFKLKKKYKAQITEASFARKKIMLVLPETSMNLSGKSIKALLVNYKTPATRIWVIHDDIDVDLGKIKIVKNKGAAGHKGVQSIINKIRTKNFIRFRIGINPDYKAVKPFSHLAMESFVLQKFTKKEKEIIKKTVKKTIEAIETALKQGVAKAMNRFN